MPSPLIHVSWLWSSFLVFSCRPIFPENQLERYDIRSKQSLEAANREVSDWKLSAGCHFDVFVAQVTSEEAYIYANTENPCLNILNNVLDARPKNLSFFHFNRRSVRRH